jgi:hypothetical protein
MKKILLILFLCFLGLAGMAEDFDYEQVYRDLPVPTFQYVHGIDPGEYYDTKNSAWTPYPLFRLTAPLFFKTTAIEPGYYTLTPRQQDGNWYILFKEAGRVKYIIPAYDRKIVPAFFYDENLPKPKMTLSQKFQINALDFIGRHIKSSRRKPAPQTYLETTDLDNNFVSLVIYWGDFRYYTIFRTIRL